MDNPRSTALRFILELGLPGLLWGAGMSLAFTSPENFVIGMIIASAGSLSLVAYSLATWWSAERPYAVHLLLCASVMLAVCGWLTFRPRPLDIRVEIGPGNYPEGMDIGGGIRWPAASKELDVVLGNPTDWPYSNIEVYVQTNLNRTEIGVQSEGNQCVAKPLTPKLNAAVQGYGEGGRFVTLPLDKTRDAPALTDLAKVTCDHLAPHTEAAATVAVSYQGYTVDRGVPPIFDQPVVTIEPAWALLVVSYEAGGRRRFVTKPRCFMPTCPGMPESITPALGS